MIRLVNWRAFIYITNSEMRLEVFQILL